MAYLNIRLNGEVETIDHISKVDFPDTKTYRAEKRSMMDHYRLVYQGLGTPYWSTRSTRDYREKQSTAK